MGKTNRHAPRLIELLETDWDAGCILWTADDDPSGYGPRLSLYGHTMSAARYALILATGINPAGLDVAHGPCHNRLCVNPLHLRWATRRENAADRRRDGTQPVVPPELRARPVVPRGQWQVASWVGGRI